MKIIVIAVQPFPIGMAATNRLISYSKGLVEIGNDVCIHIVRSTEDANNIINKNHFGEYNNIKYLYSSNSTIWPDNKFGRIINHFVGLRNSIIRILFFERVDFIFSLSTSYIINLLYFIVSRIKGIKFIRIEDEYPIMYINKKKKYSKLYTIIYLKTYFKMFDGMIVMTQKLASFYNNKIKKNAKLLITPMTVEPDRFANIEEKIDEESPYIAYCGYLGNGKDGVDILIKAFSIFSKTNTEYKLYIIGFTKDNDELAKLKQIVFDHDLDEKVIFTGKIKRDLIPKYLCNAEMLTLARPANKQAEGGFPTKLGEYLSTGKPVVCTSVGDIPKFLEDGVNSFIAEPGSIESFASKMCEVISNKKRAHEVGLNGRSLVYNVFNYKVQATRIERFLEEL